jgi:hypothetical protein
MADDTNIARKLNTEISATRDAGQPRARSPEPGARSPEPSARSRETGDWRLEPGARSPEPGARNPEPEAGSLARPEVAAVAEENGSGELWLLDPDRTSTMWSDDGVG